MSTPILPGSRFEATPYPGADEKDRLGFSFEAVHTVEFQPFVKTEIIFDKTPPRPKRQRQHKSPTSFSSPPSSTRSQKKKNTPRSAASAKPPRIITPELRAKAMRYKPSWMTNTSMAFSELFREWYAMGHHEKTVPVPLSRMAKDVPEWSRSLSSQEHARFVRARRLVGFIRNVRAAVPDRKLSEILRVCDSCQKRESVLASSDHLDLLRPAVAAQLGIRATDIALVKGEDSRKRSTSQSPDKRPSPDAALVKGDDSRKRNTSRSPLKRPSPDSTEVKEAPLKTPPPPQVTSTRFSPNVQGRKVSLGLVSNSSHSTEDQVIRVQQPPNKRARVDSPEIPDSDVAKMKRYRPHWVASSHMKVSEFYNEWYGREAENINYEGNPPPSGGMPKVLEYHPRWTSGLSPAGVTRFQRARKLIEFIEEIIQTVDGKVTVDQVLESLDRCQWGLSVLSLSNNLARLRSLVFRKLHYQPTTLKTTLSVATTAVDSSQAMTPMKVDSGLIESMNEPTPIVAAEDTAPTEVANYRPHWIMNTTTAASKIYNQWYARERYTNEPFGGLHGILQSYPKWQRGLSAAEGSRFSRGRRLVSFIDSMVTELAMGRQCEHSDILDPVLEKVTQFQNHGSILSLCNKLPKLRRALLRTFPPVDGVAPVQEEDGKMRI